MTQAQASSARTRVGLGPSVPTAPREIHPAALKRQAVGRAGSLALSPLLSEKRREENRRHSDADGDLLRTGLLHEMNLRLGDPNAC